MLLEARYWGGPGDEGDMSSAMSALLLYSKEANWGLLSTVDMTVPMTGSVGSVEDVKDGFDMEPRW